MDFILRKVAIVFWLIILLGLVVPTLQAQPNIEWEKTYGGTGKDQAFSIFATADGGYILAGNTESNDINVTGYHGNTDILIVKVSPIGAFEWSKVIGGSAFDQTNVIIQTTDGGYMLLGQSTSSDGDFVGSYGALDFWLIKLSAIGDIQWKKPYGGSGNDSGFSIIQTTDGGYAAVGWSDSNNGDVTGQHGSGGDIWFIKTTSAGILQWQKTYGGTGLEQGSSLIQTTDGGYVIAGNSTSNNGDFTLNHGNWDAVILKLSSTGTVEWQNSAGGSMEDRFYCVIETDDGNFVATGITASSDGDVTTQHGSFDVWVVKYSNVGTLLWQKSLGGTAQELGRDVIELLNGNYLVAGYTMSNNGDVSGNHNTNSIFDMWVLELTASGNLVWQNCFGSTGGDGGHGVVLTPDNGFAVAGLTQNADGDVSSVLGSGDFWILKFEGSTINTSTLINTAYCVGDTIMVDFTSIGTFHLGNEYTVQLSNAAGSFAGAVTIGTLTSTANSGTITAIVPAGAASVAGYRIRVVASSPTVIGTDNGSDITLHATSSTQTASMCQGQTYLFNNLNLNVAGVYLDTMPNQRGCDSIVTLNLTVLLPTLTSVTQMICFGDTYLGYSATGVYNDTFPTSGCDSIRILDLTVSNAIATSVTASICPGQSYFAGGVAQTTSGTYYDTLAAANSCDSVVTTILTVGSYIRSNISQGICFGDTYLGYSATGVYNDTFPTSGCDSIRTLDLTVSAQNLTNLTQTICQGQRFEGYNATGIYADTFTVSGCDSIRVLNLTVLSTIQTTDNQTICFGDNYLGYSVSGVYNDTTLSSRGCDSIHTLTLTVRGLNSDTLNLAICVGDSYNGHSTTGTYQDTFPAANGCDSIQVLYLSVDPFPVVPVISASSNVLSVPNTFASYQWYLDGGLLAGDTTETLITIANGNYTIVVTNAIGCADTSAVVNVTGIGINEVASSFSVGLYPNPTNGTVYLSIKGANQADFNLYNSLGQMLQAGSIISSGTIDMQQYYNGVYYLKVQAGGAVFTQRVLLAK